MSPRADHSRTKRLHLGHRIAVPGVDQIGLKLGLPVPDEKAKWRLAQGGIENDREGAWYAAFTVAELGEILKAPMLDRDAHISLPQIFDKANWEGTVNHNWFVDRNEADARAKMLIHMIEHDILKL